MKFNCLALLHKHYQQHNIRENIIHSCHLIGFTLNIDITKA